MFRLSLKKENEGGTLNFWKESMMYLQDNFLKDHCSSWLFQLENSGSVSQDSDNPHIQGFLNLEKRKRKEYMIKILNSESFTTGMWIQPCRDKLKALKYVSKAETRVIGPFDENNLFQLGTENLYPEEYLSWSAPIVAHTDTHAADGRSINWISDQEGGRGMK